MTKPPKQNIIHKPKGKEIKSSRLRLTDIRRKQIHCHHCMWHFSKNILQREDKAAWGSTSQTAQGTQNTAGSFKKLMLIQSTSEACIVLDLHCPTPTNQHKPVTFWVFHPHLQVLLTHPLTVPTSPRYTDIRVLPSEQFFPKPLYLCWNSRHQSHLSLLGQQEHPTALHLERKRTTSYPTVTGQVFVTGTRCSEGRTQ